MGSAAITGVGGGIGRALVELLLAKGWRVFGTVLNEAEATSLPTAWGDRVRVRVVDVRDAAAVRAWAAEVGEALGRARLGALVNNAGLAEAGPMAMAPIERFEAHLDVNLLGPWRCTQAFAPLLGMAGDRQGPPGRVVMVGSLAGLVAWPFMGGYVASKHALEGLTGVWRRELAPYGIRVLMVAPGAVATPIWAKARAAEEARDWPLGPYAEAMPKLIRIGEQQAERGLPPEAIAQALWRAIAHPWPPLRSGPGRQKPLRDWFARFGPPALVDALTARVFGLDGPLAPWPEAPPPPGASEARGEVVVTGVSSGIGQAIARRLVAQGLRVFGSVRRPADAEALQAELGEAFVPLVFDVTDPEGVAQAVATVGQALGDRRLLGLVNNAGLALAGPLALAPEAHLRLHLDVNLVAPARLSQAFAPLLGMGAGRQGPPGRIVMLGSVAGKVAWPFLGAYVASKHGLEGLSGVLRRELRPYGIGVVMVAPGAVATPIWGKAQAAERARDWPVGPYAEGLARFARMTAKQDQGGLPPEAIAEVVARALLASRAPRRVAPVKGKLANFWLPAYGPTWLLDRVLGQALGLDRPLAPWPEPR